MIPWLRQHPALLLVAAIALIPLLTRSSYHLSVLNLIGLNAIVVVGLNLLIGYAGQISLGHAAFYALGAYLSGMLTVKFGWPSWPTLFLAMAGTAGVAYLVGIPALRLKGHYLVMATLGFSLIVYIFLGQMVWLTGGPSGMGGIPHLNLLGLEFDSDLRMYYLIWFFTLLTIFISRNLVRSRVGRALRAIHDSEAAAGAAGVDTQKYKVKVFVLSAFFGSLAGSLYAHYITFISPDSFTFLYSIQVATMVIVGGMGSIWGSLFGAALLTVLGQLLHAVKDYNIIAFGLILVLALMFFPEGVIFGFARQLRRRSPASFLPDGPPLARRAAVSLNPGPPDSCPGFAEAGPAGRLPCRQPEGKCLLELQNVRKTFGGLMALHDVSLEFQRGEITAIIGPNGAGKTTLLNVIAGVYRPDSGRVRLNGNEISGLKPFQIAALGVTRTFQSVRVFPRLTVWENILVGFHPKTGAEFTSCLLRLPRVAREERAVADSAERILELLELSGKKDLPAASLHYSDRKRLEIGRALAVSPQVVLLDEPAAGLNAGEVEEITRLIGAMRRMEISLALVEHNMDVVMGIADRVIVLNYGEKIAEGTPGEVQRDERVIQAYLGALPDS